MMRSTLPKRAVVLITTVIVAGAASLALRAGDLSRWTITDAIALAALVLATVAGEQFSVRVRFGAETKHVTLTEAAYAAALLLGVRASVLTAAVALGFAAGHAIRGTALHKLAFNVGSVTAAVTAAELVYAPLHATSPILAAAAAMGAFFVVNASTIVGMIALATGRSFAQVFAPIARLETVHAMGNLALGAAAAAIWLVAPAAVLAAIPAAALATLRYRAIAPV